MYSCMIFLSKSFALPEEGQNNCGNEGPYTKGDLILIGQTITKILFLLIRQTKDSDGKVRPYYNKRRR